MDPTYPQIRWIEAIQKDFAARADWCVKRYEDANHAPVVKLNHESRMMVKPSTSVKLSGQAIDPDGDGLIYRWWQYKEVGTFKNEISISNSETPDVIAGIPASIKKGETIHIILEVSDDQFPNMTRYQRLLLTAE